MSRDQKWAPESAMFFNPTCRPRAIAEPHPVVRQEPTAPEAQAVSNTLLLQALTVNSGSVPALIQRITNRTGNKVVIRSEEAHWALRSMEKKGWVESYRAPSGFQRSLRCYQLTPAGARVADERRLTTSNMFSPIAVG